MKAFLCRLFAPGSFGRLAGAGVHLGRHSPWGVWSLGGVPGAGVGVGQSLESTAPEAMELLFVVKGGRPIKQ